MDPVNWFCPNFLCIDVNLVLPLTQWQFYRYQGTYKLARLGNWQSSSGKGPVNWLFVKLLEIISMKSIVLIRQARVCADRVSRLANRPMEPGMRPVSWLCCINLRVGVSRSEGQTLIMSLEILTKPPFSSIDQTFQVWGRSTDLRWEILVRSGVVSKIFLFISFRLLFCPRWKWTYKYCMLVSCPISSGMDPVIKLKPKFLWIDSTVKTLGYAWLLVTTYRSQRLVRVPIPGGMGPINRSPRKSLCLIEYNIPAW